MAKTLLALCFDWWLGAPQICFIFISGWNKERSLSLVSSGSEFCWRDAFHCQLSDRSAFARVFESRCANDPPFTSQLDVAKC